MDLSLLLLPAAASAALGAALFLPARNRGMVKPTSGGPARPLQPDFRALAATKEPAASTGSSEPIGLERGHVEQQPRVAATPAGLGAWMRTTTMASFAALMPQRRGALDSSVVGDDEAHHATTVSEAVIAEGSSRISGDADSSTVASRFAGAHGPTASASPWNVTARLLATRASLAAMLHAISSRIESKRTRQRGARPPYADDVAAREESPVQTSSGYREHPSPGSGPTIPPYDGAAIESLIPTRFRSSTTSSPSPAGSLEPTTDADHRAARESSDIANVDPGGAVHGDARRFATMLAAFVSPPADSAADVSEIDIAPSTAQQPIVETQQAPSIIASSTPSHDATSSHYTVYPVTALPVAGNPESNSIVERPPSDRDVTAMKQTLYAPQRSLNRAVPITRLPLRHETETITWPQRLDPSLVGLSASERHQVLDAAIERRIDVETLSAAYREETVEGRIRAVRALGKSNARGARALLIEALRTGTDAERSAAIDALLAIQAPEPVRAAIGDRVEAVAAQALLAVASATGVPPTREAYLAVALEQIESGRANALLALLSGFLT